MLEIPFISYEVSLNNSIVTLLNNLNIYFFISEAWWYLITVLFSLCFIIYRTKETLKEYKQMLATVLISLATAICISTGYTYLLTQTKDRKEVKNLILEEGKSYPFYEKDEKVNVISNNSGEYIVNINFLVLSISFLFLYLLAYFLYFYKKEKKLYYFTWYISEILMSFGLGTIVTSIVFIITKSGIAHILLLEMGTHETYMNAINSYTNGYMFSFGILACCFALITNKLKESY